MFHLFMISRGIMVVFEVPQNSKMHVWSSLVILSGAVPFEQEVQSLGATWNTLRRGRLTSPGADRPDLARNRRCQTTRPSGMAKSHGFFCRCWRINELDNEPQIGTLLRSWLHNSGIAPMSL